MMLMVLAPVALLTGLLLGMLQANPMDSPIVVALLALLAIPAVASALTTGLLKATGWGIKPQTVVYVFCGLLIAGIAVVNGGVPMIDAANPAATVVAWQAWVAIQSEYTKALYDILFKRLWKSPDPAPADVLALK